MIWEGMVSPKCCAYTTKEGRFQLAASQLNNKPLWDKVLADPTVSFIDLPSLPTPPEDILPFIQRFAKRDSSLQSLWVRSPEFSLERSLKGGMATMKYQNGLWTCSPSSSQSSLHNRIKVLQELRCQMMKIENLQALSVEVANDTFAEQPNFRDWLQHPNCAIRDLQMNFVGEGIEDAFTKYCQEVANYNKLTKLTLFVEVALPLHQFCPKSQLVELHLHFGHDLSRDWCGIARDFLNQHPSLTICRISPSQVDEAAAEPIVDLSQALSSHPSLRELEIGLGLWRVQGNDEAAPASNRMWRELAAATEQNPRLRELKINYSYITMDAVLEAIPKFHFLQTLEVNTWYRTSRRDMERLALVLHKNVSLTEFWWTRFWWGAQDDACIRQTLVRNKLLARANHVLDQDTLSGMPRSILAPLLAKLGSNHGEGSAVHSLLLRWSNMFATLLKIRKGKRSCL